MPKKAKPSSSKSSDNDLLTFVDPLPIYFTFSRIRPVFSCGRSVLETLEALRCGGLSVSDLPPICALVDGNGAMFSLNNRRLYVLKQLAKEKLLPEGQVGVRLRPVPSTKRMLSKYTPQKCSLEATLMPAKKADLLHDDGDDEPEQSDDSPEDGERVTNSGEQTEEKMCVTDNAAAKCGPSTSAGNANNNNNSRPKAAGSEGERKREDLCTDVNDAPEDEPVRSTVDRNPFSCLRRSARKNGKR